MTNPATLPLSANTTQILGLCFRQPVPQHLHPLIRQLQLQPLRQLRPQLPHRSIPWGEPCLSIPMGTGCRIPAKAGIRAQPLRSRVQAAQSPRPMPLVTFIPFPILLPAPIPSPDTSRRVYAHYCQPGHGTAERQYNGQFWDCAFTNRFTNPDRYAGTHPKPAP